MAWQRAMLLLNQGIYLMCYRQSARGATLIELLVTVAILAIIAAIAIPAYNGYIDASYRTDCRNEVAAIKLAEEEYFLENNTYFLGANAGALQTNSSSMYQAPTGSNCAYSVTSSSPTTTYTVTAVGTGTKIPTTETVVTFVK